MLIKATWTKISDHRGESLPKKAGSVAWFPIGSTAFLQDGDKLYAKYGDLTYHLEQTSTQFDYALKTGNFEGRLVIDVTKVPEDVK